MNLRKDMVREFLDLPMRTYQALRKYLFFRQSEKNLNPTWDYDTITLKLFMHIAKTGEVELCGGMEQWESIVQKNSIANEVHEYSNYVESLKSHALLVNQYIVTKAHIDKLSMPVFGYGKIDIESFNYLLSKGYNIATHSKEAYIKSLTSALKKRENLLTRINMKRKELERIALQQQEKPGQEKNLEQLLAVLSLNLGFPVQDDITLARYNEYNKIIRKQQEQQKANGRNNQR